MLADTRSVADGPLPGPGRRAWSHSHAAGGLMGLLGPEGADTRQSPRFSRISHRHGREVASRSGYTEYADGTWLRLLPRISRRHDGQLHDASPARKQLHAAKWRDDRSGGSRDRSL